MNDVITSVAKHFEPVISQWPGAKSYGVADFTLRNGIRMPVVGSNYVGPDDRSPIILYHRISAFNIAELPRTGYGDALNDANIQAQIFMLVYFDTKVIKMNETSLLLYLVANLPERVAADNFESIQLRATGGVVDSNAVLATEFQGADLRIPEQKRMFQLNYTIAAQFKKACFKSCAC